MLEAALIANPWSAAALVIATYILGYVSALYEARLYYAGAKERIVYREGYPQAREYADTWQRRRPASGRFLAQLLVLAIALPLVGQVTVQRLGQPALFQTIVGGLVLAEVAASLEHLRHITLFRQVLSGLSVGGQLELSRRATLTVRYVEWYSLAALFLLIALVAGSWFCAGGALGCVVSAQRLRDWVIMRT